MKQLHSSSNGPKPSIEGTLGFRRPAAAPHVKRWTRRLEGDAEPFGQPVGHGFCVLQFSGRGYDAVREMTPNLRPAS